MTRSSELRIAFIVEPLPVRSGPEDFEWPFLHFCSIAEALNRSGAAKTYIFGPDQLINKYQICCHGIKGSTLGFDQSWPKRWRQEWTNFLNGQDNHKVSLISEIIARELIDVVYIWSKNDTLRKASIEGGARVIHVELSPIRSPMGLYWMLDPDGVGPDSLASEMIVGNEFSKRSDLNLNYCLSDLISDQSLRLKTASNRKKRLLVPLQLDYDINTILWNSYGNQYKSLKELLLNLANYRDIDLTVRSHPASKRDYSTLVKLHAPEANYVTGATPLWESLTHWDGVIHVNSSVGFEAQLLSMNVCSLGAGLTSRMTASGKYGTKIESFIKSSVLSDDPSNNVEGARNFEILRKYFTVPDFIANKPSTYALVASAITSFPGSTKSWFQTCGLQETLKNSQIQRLEYEIASLRAQNHYRILDYKSHEGLHATNQKYIDELRSENQIRIDEIRFLGEKIRSMP